MARLGLCRQLLSRNWTLLGGLCLLLAVSAFTSYGFGQPAPAAADAVTTAVNVVKPTSEVETPFKYFGFLSDPNFTRGEVAALFGCIIVALMALAYAGMLVKQVVHADQGTQKMKDIAAAVREGANAYLARQLKVVFILIFILLGVLFMSRYAVGGNNAVDYAVGRTWAFAMGACFPRWSVSSACGWPPPATSASPPPRRWASAKP